MTVFRSAALSLTLHGILCAAANADELVLPPALERGRSAEVVYRFDTPQTGRGFLDVEWSDSAGRLVDRQRIPLELADMSQVAFMIDLRRAVTQKNELVAHFSFDPPDRGGNTVHRENRAAGSFIVTPPGEAWSDYQIIMWQAQTPAGYATLKKIGLTAGMLETSHRDAPVIYSASSLTRLVDADLRCYLENIATDFYSPYHRWHQDRPVNWRFLAVKERYWANPNDRTAFVRDPSLSDPAWLQRVEDRLIRSVRALHAYRPLYYSLGDETGIGDLAAFWDFDLSDSSLAGMREWLKDGYENLTGLNRQWGTSFSSWGEVVPMTTDQAMKRSDENFSAWADFKEWMDVAFARAVKRGTDAVHFADPDAVAAIEGAQIPGWGGYDYSRLADSVDAIELYDYGENVAIARSLNPELILLTTSFRSGAPEAHRVWRELLGGTRGLILWDDKREFVGEDGILGDRGREAEPYFGEIRSGLGGLLINSRRRTAPIGILYSPASRRVQWLLDRRATGEEWSRRNASTEYQDDVIRTSTRSFAATLEHMGLQARFVSSAAVRRGELRNGNYRVLILPHTIALAPNEAKEIRDFVEQGGVVIAEGMPGSFDEHGRRLDKPLLSEVFAGPATRSANSFAFGKGKAVYLALADGRRRDGIQRITGILDAAGITPPFFLSRLDGQPVRNVETSIFTNGELRVVALQRDYLDPSKRDGGETVVVTLPRPFNVYDLRAQRAFGNTSRLELELGPIEPALLALSEKPVSAPTIVGPSKVRRGENAEFLVRSNAPAARAVVHLDVVDPQGGINTQYSGNLLIAGEPTVKLLPFALNDKAGVWKILGKDWVSGQTATAQLTVEP